MCSVLHDNLPYPGLLTRSSQQVPKLLVNSQAPRCPGLITAVLSYPGPDPQSAPLKDQLVGVQKQLSALCTWVYTHTCAPAHMLTCAYIHMCTHTRSHIHIHGCARAHTDTYMHVRTHMCPCMHRPARAQICSHLHTCAYTRAPMHTCAYTHVRACTQDMCTHV